MNAIQVSRTGGPEVLNYTDVPTPRPKPNEVLVKLAAIGVNFIDVYHREGRYSLKTPFIPGQEAAGTVAEVGNEVKTFKPGDRVVFAAIVGSYAEYQSVPADRVVTIPAGLSERDAAAVILQGMTAHYLLYDTYPVRKGETILAHAAAGGVGLLLVQMAHQIGARVIGTVSSEQKARLARDAGADEIIRYTEQDFESETKRLTNNQGVHVVYDSVGKTTFDRSLNVLRPRGYMVLYGGSSGAVPPFDLIELSQKGSLFVTRPTLGHYVLTREDLEKRSSAVLGMVASGKLKLRVEHIYSLKDAQQAHIELQGRKTTGKLLLIP
ncbi:MAG TPA: quinone oxidoreductase [Terriglobales bacterium]|nr:quinone oxidoreductase [Terriglobales bacterium]